MANIKSAQKRIDVIERNTARNKSNKSKMKTAIKKANASIESGEIDNAKTALPDFVSTDVKKDIQSRLKTIESFALLNKSADEIKKTLDCTEGLENGLKHAAEEGECEIAHTLTNSRYVAIDEPALS